MSFVIGCPDRSSLAGVPIAIRRCQIKSKRGPKRAEKIACEISSPEGMLYTPFRTLPMSPDRILYLCTIATAKSPAPFDARALLCTSLVSQMGHRDVGVMILPTLPNREGDQGSCDVILPQPHIQLPSPFHCIVQWSKLLILLVAVRWARQIEVSCELAVKQITMLRSL